MLWFWPCVRASAREVSWIPISRFTSIALQLKQWSVRTLQLTSESTWGWGMGGVKKLPTSPRERGGALLFFIISAVDAVFCLEYFPSAHAALHKASIKVFMMTNAKKMFFKMICRVCGAGFGWRGPQSKAAVEVLWASKNLCFRWAWVAA